MADLLTELDAAGKPVANDRKWAGMNSTVLISPGKATRIPFPRGPTTKYYDQSNLMGVQIQYELA